MIIKIEEYKNLHFYGRCEDCEWDVGISSDTNTRGVKREIRKHVGATGHTVVLETGSQFLYQPSKPITKII